jgi:hypothetical protein
MLFGVDSSAHLLVLTRAVLVLTRAVRRPEQGSYRERRFSIGDSLQRAASKSIGSMNDWPSMARHFVLDLYLIRGREARSRSLGEDG